MTTLARRNSRYLRTRRKKLKPKPVWQVKMTVEEVASDYANWNSRFAKIIAG